MERKNPEADTISMRHITIGEPLSKGDGHISAAGFDYRQSVELGNTINDRYLVDVDPDAPACCIDGRCALHTMAGEGTALGVGPHISGGPLFTAFGAAELVPGYYGDKSAAASLGRLEEVKATLLAANIKLGAHVSEGAVRNGFKNPVTGASQTGCGLNDGFKDVMDKPAAEKQFVDDTTALLMGTSFNADAMRFNAKGDIENRVSDYDPYKALNTFLGEERNYGGVEVLGGEHGEKLVVFNYHEGKTVDRDALVRDTGKQVFIVDMWYLDKLATAMAAGRPDAVDTPAGPGMITRLTHAMVAFQVATYLALCDGSHRPVILKPEPAVVPQPA